MRFPQTASASPANARERRTLPPPPPPSPPSPSPRRDRSRTRKKQKRLDAIRDRVLDPVEHGAGGSGAVDVDPSSLRRSTRQRRPPAPRIREGRRCGLCGGGTDGKPPKRLVRDSAESDHEVYGGSSASEEPNYDVLDGFGDESGWLGPLLGPIHDRFGIAGVWVHQHCAVWSPEVYFAGLGRLKNVRAALCRGRALKCSRCGQPGATIGCRVDRCPKTYHLPCSRADGCIFDHRKFLIACTDHRHLFQPQGSLYLHRINKLRAKKMKLDMRKLSIDAWRKDFETEEKWLENCGEDEEFLRREGKRLHRDITRIAPVHIGGSSFDGEKSYQGWESVAGLKDVIQCMKEVVILPLLYPEFFSTLGLTPPRGVLLHGYPGTGKTLVVRALIGACSRGDKRIAYFARKGADCLGKYVGDAERQLRLLFQVAERSQPSIIFFDEIDGLAPRRCRQQDQTHSSVVSTLLALLDGLKSRGSVIVIGATNRPEALDPALRRPGRFDREIYFPLPSAEDRSAILSLHTQRWPKPVSGSLLTWVAEQTPGFAGADLQSLCTQAAMIALKRNCALQELLSAAEKYPSNVRRHSLPSFVVDERDWLAALASAPPPCFRREAGIAANGVVSSPLHKSLVPCLLLPLSHLLTSLYHDERIQLPPPLYKAATLINGVINFAMQQKKIPIAFWSTHLHSLIQEPEIAGEIERKLSCAGLLMGTPYSSNCGLLDDDIDHEKLEFHKSNPSGSHVCRNLVHNFSYSQGIKSRFRLLVAGTPRSGQQHLAACLLHGFLGHVEIQKVSLATMSQEGHGDLVQGITHILLKCLSMGRCIIYMPRIDLWAVDGAHHETSELESGFCQRVSKSTLTREHHDGLDNASDSWNSFVEQVDSVCSSASLMILATCEMPNHAIPLRIRQFFTRDVLNCKDSAPSEHTIPRFLVQVDGNFSRELVIDSSAAKLLLDLVQQYIQLIHHGSHKCNSNTLNEVKIVNTVEVNSEVQILKAEKGATNVVMDTEVGSERIPLSDSVCTDINIQQSKNDNNRCSVKSSCQLEDEVWLQPHCDPLSKLTQNRIAKGKSNLLMTIATFGYQILRYPHFAELCWATSKLKEGPCTGINGPWKVWPFNTCIIHADRSLEKEGSKCNATNHKSRERSGVVRGLVAVGLLAYRGVYTSIREVSLEVRKVLELLVSEIDRKIQGGKDRWRFLRLLSQVAYFEDMVNSWAYGLRSFEMDNQVSSLNSRAVIVKREDTDGHNLVTNDTCMRDVDNESEKEVNFLVPEQSPSRFSNEHHGSVDSNKEGTHFDIPDSEAGTAISECPLKGVVSGSCAAGFMQSCATAAGLSASKSTSTENNNLEYTSENPARFSVLHDGIQSLKQANGSGVMETALPSEDVCNPDDSAIFANSTSRKGGGQCNGMPMRETVVPFVDGDHGLSEPVGGTYSIESEKLPSLPETCLYKCCSECLHTVQVLIRGILSDSLESNGRCSTVEDVHDAVAACSVGVLAAISKYFVAERCTNPDMFCSTELKHGTHGCEHCACQDVSGFGIKNKSHLSRSSTNREVVPMKCICHSKSKESAATMNVSEDSHFGQGLKIFFKDSVLMPSDPDNDAVFHCKFEDMCLCPIIERILIIKPPLD
ncbi:hypothetical protein AAC387_Pa06g0291 [Persea americana]